MKPNLIKCGLTKARYVLSMGALSVPMLPLVAYESYHDPALNDQGYCSMCHPGFGGGRSDTLHALHTGGSDPVTTNCNLCHTGSGRNNPLTMWSTGDDGDGLGCMGCHGRDYGQTIGADYDGNSTNGLPKNSGVGLRLHHAINGITLCAGCHSGDPTPYPENVIDPGLGNTVHYYLRADVSLGGNPVDPSSNEDSANDANSTALDNDGDDLYDEADPDSILDPDDMEITLLPSGSLQLTWPTPSPLYAPETNPGLDPGSWSAMTPPAYTQRVNGFWYLTIDQPFDPKQFYRLNKPEAAAVAAAPGASVKGGRKPIK